MSGRPLIAIGFRSDRLHAGCCWNRLTTTRRGASHARVSIPCGSRLKTVKSRRTAHQATTHPDAAPRLCALGIDVLDQPLVCRGNVVTAGGCLSAVYLTGWVVQQWFGADKRREALRELLPAGQQRLFEELIDASIERQA